MNRKERRAARKTGAPAATAGLAADDPFALAVQYFRAGQFAEADRVCREVLARDPGHFHALTMFGLLAMRAGRNDIAVDVFEQALAVNEGDSDCHFNRGYALAAIGRIDEAARHLTRAIEINPAFANAMIGLGNVRKEQGDLDAAAAQYRRALALQPDPTAHYNLGSILQAQGRMEEAVASYRAALACGERSPELFNNLAQALAAQGKGDDALSAFRQALALKPDHPDVLTNFGTFHAVNGNPSEAIELYRRAMTARPGTIEVRNNLATVLMKQGGFAEAFVCLEQALALKAEHPDTQVNLCAALYGLSYEDRDLAVAQARRLLETHADKPVLRRGLAGLIGTSADDEEDRNYSRALFDHFAGSFDSTLASLGYLDMPRAIADTLEIEAGPGGLDTLDVGCGTGLCGPLFKPAARTLTGVDLSPRMLDKARARSIYDELAVGDVTEFMTAHPAAFDLIVASDVLTYMGGISPLLHAAHGSLRDGGRIAMSAESLDHAGGGEGCRLGPSGRYQHSRGYLETSFRAAGLTVTKVAQSSMRREAGRDVAAWIVVAEKR
jgi:predicted TPR repeat methyltransferase